MDVLLDRQQVRLDDCAVLGVGGEATVIQHKRWAVKVYHTPTPARAAKLHDLAVWARRLPPAVVGPEALVYDARRRQIVGFAMRLLDPAYTEVAHLSNKGFRTARGITAADVGTLFCHSHSTLTALHGLGFVVGDLNDLNVLFRGGEMAFIDVDSYQFGPHRCEVGTESFIDPALYGVDLSKRPAFHPDNDWYSYAVLLFKSLLLVHPYGGVHPTLKTLTARAQQRMTALAPGVRYPKIALHPDLLSDDLLHLFDHYFAAGQRGTFPLDALQAYLGALTPCAGCGVLYPRERHHCPVCAAQTPVARPERRIVADHCTVDTLIQTRGQIVLCKALGDAVYTIAHEDGQAVLYVAQPGAESRRAAPLTRKMALFRQISAARYDALDGYLVIAPDPAGEALMVVDVSGDRPRGVLQTTTRLFGGAEPVFGAARGMLFRLAGASLMRGEIRGGELVERAITSVMENQTWLRFAPQGDMALGYLRTFESRQYFLIYGAERHEIALPPLSPGESVTAHEAMFGGRSALLVRHTRLAGTDYVRVDEIDDHGEVVFSRRTPRLDTPLYATLGGQIYDAGMVLHPTDDGVVQERLADGALRAFAATEPYVAEGDRLIPYQSGILVVKSDRVLLLQLT